MSDKEQPKCGLCGEPMPAGEEMFKYHGASGPCPKPPQHMNIEDGYYWLKLAPIVRPQIVSVVTGTAWGPTPSIERRKFVMFVGSCERVLIEELFARHPDALWAGRVATPEQR